METVERSRKPFPAWIWAVMSLLVWGALLIDQAPSIAADDSGETVTAAMTLGIPHPPGHVLLNLLGRLVLLVPLGGSAFRINLFSAALLVLSAFLLSRWTLRKWEEVSGGTSDAVRIVAGLAAFLTLATAFPAIRQSQTAKGAVYLLSLLFSVLFLNLCRFDKDASSRRLSLVSFLAALWISLHWPSAAVGSAFVLYWAWRRVHLDRMDWLKAGIFLIIGLSPMLYLPLRSHLSPELNWGSPDTWNAFRWVLRRAPYAELETEPRSVGLYAHQAWMAAKTLLTCCPWASLGLVGYLFWRRRDPRAAVGWGIAVGMPLAAVALVPRLTEETFFLVPAYLTAFLGAWSFLAATGVAVLIEWIAGARPKRAAFVSGVAVVLLTGWGIWITDRESQVRRLIPHDLGTNVLLGLPKGAVLLAEGDVYVMSVFYARWVEGLRPDVVFVPAIFLNDDWGYAQALKKLQPDARPHFPLLDFGHRVNGFLKLALPSESHPTLPVHVSTGKGAVEKAPPDPSCRFSPAGLSYEIRKDDLDPELVRSRLWALGARQRRRGNFNYRRESTDNVYAKELYGYYGNHYLLGANELQRYGRLQAAADDYCQALSIYPKSAEAHGNLAAVMGASRLFDLAEVFCRKAMRLDPEYAGAWDNLGNVYALQGRWDDALEAYGKALALKPDSAPTQANLEHAQSMRGRSIPEPLEAKNAEWYDALGRKFAQESRWILSEAAFETSWVLGNDSAECWNNRGVARAQQGEWKIADEAFETAIRKNKNFAETYKNYGFLLIQEGRRAKARRILETGRDVAPDHTEIQILLDQLDGKR